MRDVESLLMRDDLGPDRSPRYDTADGVREPVMRAMTQAELRERVARTITARVVAPPKPFSHETAARVMLHLDLQLHAYLVNPDMVGTIRSMVPPGVPVYEHESVPSCRVFALSEPQYLGVLAVKGPASGVLVHGRCLTFPLDRVRN